MKITSKKFSKYVKQNKLKINEETLQERFDEILNDVYPKFLNSYLPSKILKEIDPTRHRTEFLNYIDSLIKDGSLIRFEDGYIETETLKNTLSNNA